MGPHTGEIRCRCLRHWKNVLPDDNLIAHEQLCGRCSPVSSAAAVAAVDVAFATAAAAAAAASTNDEDEAYNAPDNVPLIDARYSPR